MTKTLRKIVIIATIVAIALVSTVSFAAWQSSNKTLNSSIETGSVKILDFDASSTVSLAGLQPYDQSTDVSWWAEGKGYQVMTLKIKPVAGTDAVPYDITVSNFTASGFTGVIKYALTLPTNATDAALVTTTLGDKVISTGQSTTVSQITEVKVYVWLESTDVADMGKTITFDITVSETP